MKMLFYIIVLGLRYFMSTVGDCEAFLINAFGIKNIGFFFLTKN